VESLGSETDDDGGFSMMIEDKKKCGVQIADHSKNVVQ